MLRAIIHARFVQSPAERPMSALAGLHIEGRPPARGRLAAEGVLFFTLLVLILLGVTALGFVAYALWPRGPDTPAAADAPALPITVADVPFNVPPQAMRIAVQRRAGAQERVDLVFLSPSLATPDTDADVALGAGKCVSVLIAVS